MPQPDKAAFTLVELMVVVTIIVILIALLSPALDRAVYRAELAVCAARLRGVVGAVTVYAAGSRRAYPHRPGVDAFANWSADMLNDAGYTPSDDRPMLRNILSVNRSLQCPFHRAIDLDGAADDSIVLSGYTMFFGYGFAGQQRMQRLGNRWTWGGVRYAWLVTDKDETSTGGWAAHSHPDATGVMEPQVYEHRVILGAQAAGVTVGDPYDFSRWGMSGNHTRGPVDSHAAAEDGSVLRFDGLTVTPGTDEVDERLDRIPRFASGAATTPEAVLVPRP